MHLPMPTVGWIHLCSSLTCTPLLIRMCYVFISYQEYRRHDCYRIIAQYLALHIFCGSAYILYGVGILFNHDLFGLGRIAHITTITSFCCMITIDVVLAINRVILITQVEVPQVFTSALQIIVWIEFGVLYFFLCSPFGGLQLGSDQYTITYDSTKAFSWIFDTFRFYSTVSLSCTSLTLYVFIWIFLGYRMYRFKKTMTSKAERNIALQAGLTFSLNAFTGFVYHYCYLTLMEREWTSLLYVFEQMMNFMYVPLIVYLTFNSKLRRQVFFQPSVVEPHMAFIITTNVTPPSVVT
uniref:7TM_GPCR_Srx domain-containing protein n=1 Tax=Steinernema glaseri TaxID=37863 RepID=A0A1I7YTC2_9BILA